MLRRIAVMFAVASTLALSASAYEDPIADEIQQRMMEEARLANEQRAFIDQQQAWEAEQDDYAYEEPPAYSAEEWVDWSAASTPPQPSVADDPKYQAYLNGEWLHTAPGKSRQQTCSLLFLRQGAGAMLIATGGLEDPALFAFFGMNVPSPAALTKVQATLSQTDDAPATVDVYNAALSWLPNFGVVFFAVPSAKAALAGMLDAQSFGVAMNGGTVVSIAWTGGLAARDQLQACLAARR